MARMLLAFLQFPLDTEIMMENTAEKGLVLIFGAQLRRIYFWPILCACIITAMMYIWLATVKFLLFRFVVFGTNILSQSLKYAVCYILNMVSHFGTRNLQCFL